MYYEMRKRKAEKKMGHGFSQGDRPLTRLTRLPLITTTLAVGLSVLLMGCSAPPQNADTQANAALGQQLPVTAEALIAGQVVQLEVAGTPTEQAMGLMYRPSLDDNRGMLFRFRGPRRAQFWMKNVQIPLDMVFLLNGEVRGIVTAPPCEADPCPTYGPNDLVDSVIELRGGRASELGLSEGDRITIQPITPSQTQP